MSPDQHLAGIDLLGTQAFPAQQRYITAELATSTGLVAKDPAERITAAERFHDDKEDAAHVLTESWGEPERIGLQTIRLRTATEEIPEPWARLSLTMGDVYLWELTEHGRWAALGVADLDPDDEIQLLLVVTDTDPP
ncbi:hypothetical protein [Streptomyces griseus]|uniref:hypothetical protein n=1 Tax=Streptomyces griseus TaxID=1911 RepID=UPI000567B894|nr:hypothetical protein [Streptomyces griseus]